MKLSNLLGAVVLALNLTATATAGTSMTLQEDGLSRARNAFSAQAVARANGHSAERWYTEDTVYEYSAPAQALSLAWHGRPAVLAHLDARKLREESIDPATLHLFATNYVDVFFAQYETAGANPRRVIAVVEMQGAQIAKIREFAQAETIAEALAASRRTALELSEAD